MSRRVLVALTAAALVAVGGVVGVIASGGGETEHSAAEPLGSSSIGNTEIGRRLFVAKRCSDCHSYQGRGGEDAPALDFMKGKMSAQDVANMSGRLWNHEPAMVARFKEENVPFPTFGGNEMADLIAYLHGGGPPPDVKGGHMEEEGEEGRMEGGKGKTESRTESGDKSGMNGMGAK